MAPFLKVSLESPAIDAMIDRKLVVVIRASLIGCREVT